MKEEALKLADFIEKYMVDFGLILGEVSRDHIVGTIRKLVAELDKKDEAIDDLIKAFHERNELQLVFKDKQKPLSDKKINDIAEKYLNIDIEQCDLSRDIDLLTFARAIEKAHGIK